VSKGKDHHVPASHQSLRAAQNEQGVVRVEASSGILPPAHELKVLEEICPGAANRLLAMAEQQLANRHAIDLADTRRDDRAVEVFAEDLARASSERTRGQWIAGGLVILSLASSVACAITGHDWVAGALAGGSITTVVSAFVLRKPSPKPEIQARVPENDSPS
jgi:uncharacterized membrane protein